MSSVDPVAAFKEGLQSVANSIRTPAQIAEELRLTWKPFLDGVGEFGLLAQAKSPTLDVQRMERGLAFDGETLCYIILARRGDDQIAIDADLQKQALFFAGGSAEFQASHAIYLDGIPVTKQNEALSILGQTILDYFA